MASRAAVFGYGGAALLRASTDPGGLDLPRDLDLSIPGSGGSADAAAGQLAWLTRTWERDEVRLAVEAASPALAAQADSVVSGGCRDAGQVRRTVLATASYLLRWQRRATPFGLFAGTGPARVGGPPRVTWGGQRVVARADAGWLGDVIARLHRCPELMSRVSVMASDTAVVRGSRVTVPGPAPDGPGQELAPVEVSVRCTGSAASALAGAAEPVPFGVLVTNLLADFPAAGQERVRGLLAGLTAQGLLVSGLRAPMTETDALGYLCTRLGDAGAQDVPEVAGLARELAVIRDELSAVRPPGAVPGQGVARLMRKVDGGAETPVVLDTLFDLDLCVPVQVAQEACAAASALHRVSPYPAGHPAWVAYRERLADRYGTGALVPVLELTADSGLGFPAGYLGAARPRPARAATRRDTRVLELVQRAMADGSGEITLDDALIGDLAGGTGEVAVPGRAEIAVEVRAVSLEALDRGRFTLAVTGAPRPGSSMIGRHASLLDSSGREPLAASFAGTGPGTVAAQLSFAPRKRRNENVARTARFLPLVIPVGEHRPAAEGVIPLADLAVTASDENLFLVRLSTGQLVEPRVTHALEAGTHTPPLARFLAEVTTAHCAVYQGFDYGAAGRLPYLPRVCYQRTILAPARWLLSAGDLPGLAATVSEWEDALTVWRSRWRVPGHVAMTDGDRRQPVDLSHPFHRVLLRDRLRRAGRLELREAAAPGELGWIGRAHELALALRATGPGRPAVSSALSRTGPGDGRPAILCALVGGHPARFEEILTDHVPGLIAALAEDVTAWWFARRMPGTDADGEQHLELWLELPGTGRCGAAAAEAIAWGGRLRSCRLASGVTVGIRDPQPGQFGHGHALSAAHRVLSADSAAAIAQIAVSARAGLDTRAVAAASMAGIAAGLAGSDTEGTDWLLRALPRLQGATEPWLREQALALAGLCSGGPTSPALGADVAATWEARAVALAAYRERLAGQRDPVTVLGILLRAHCNRMTGADAANWPTTSRLARACALRCAATRHEAAR